MSKNSRIKIPSELIIKTPQNAKKEIKNILKNLKPGMNLVVNELQPKLPEGWTNFRIIETVHGSFTGKVDIALVYMHTYSRVKLRNITKKYLESLIHYEIVSLKSLENKFLQDSKKR